MRANEFPTWRSRVRVATALRFQPRRYCITIAGWPMSLDTSTLYLVATMVAAMLGAMLLFFGKQENIPALKWWGTAYLLGAASVALWTLTGDTLGADAFAGAECRRFRRLRHGLERIARVSRPQAQLARPGSGRDDLGSCRHDDGASGIGDAHDHWRRHSCDLCDADGHRIGVRAAPDIAKALADDRGAGDARFRADAADPAWRSVMAARRHVLQQYWVTVFSVELVLYAVATAFVIFMLVSERAVTAHRTAASMDPLTGMFNRRGFAEATSRVIEREANAGRPVTVLIFDIDHFKSINDRFGHPAGDEILKLFAAVVVNTLRITDLSGRIGGEEFAALLPCSLEDAVIAAERVREAFESSGIVDEDRAGRYDRQHRRGRWAGGHRARSVAGSGGYRALSGQARWPQSRRGGRGAAAVTGKMAA